LDKILSSRGVYYDWKKDGLYKEFGGKHDMGMIAEEVGKVIPEIVTYEENGIDAKTLEYGRLTPMLVEAIKEQQKQIEILMAQNAKQQEEINALKMNYLWRQRSSGNIRLIVYISCGFSRHIYLL